jgi:hypothetical protein
VVKAFNTNLAATLASGTVGEVPVTVLIAGDDSQAKHFWPTSSPPAACARSTRAPCAGPAN